MLKFPFNPNYSVTKDGKVYSHITNRFLKLRRNKRGYLYVRIKIDGKKRNMLIHRMVALTYIPNPENKRCINHLNRFVDDNRIENLEWATHAENSIHKFKCGYRISSAARALMSKDNFADTLGYISPYATFDGYWYQDAAFNSLTELANCLNISCKTATRRFLKGEVQYILNGRPQPLNDRQRKQRTIDQLRLENKTI